MKNSKCRLKTFLFLLTITLFSSSSFALDRLPPPDYPLLEAVKTNDVHKVRAILDAARGAIDLNRAGMTGDWPLTVAASRGNPEIVRLLVERGAVVDIGKDRDKRTPLIEAASNGYAEIVQYLIAAGADVNAVGRGLTPLMAACVSGGIAFGSAGDKAKTIRILLENGANVNVRDDSWRQTGRTPLMYAVMQGDAALVQILLGKGARLDLKNKDGHTALSLAEKEGLEYIAQLLKACAGKNCGSVRAPDFSTHPLWSAIGEGRLDRVQKLIVQGTDVNLRMPSGSTPLMAAADGNQPAIVVYLLEHGADVNAKNGRNQTAIIFAASKGHAEIVRELLKYKADVNLRSLGGGDALIYAVINKKKDVVELLLKHGAGVNNLYDNGQSALIMAVNDGSVDIARLLIAYKANVDAGDKDQKTALMIACEKGNADLAEALFKAGASVNLKSKYGDTALDKAISAHHVRIVRMLVENNSNYDRKSAVFSAVIAGNLEIIRLLMTGEVNVNMRGFGGNTLLMLAADADVDIVKYLMEKGADPALRNDEGETALMKAVRSYKETGFSTVRYLIERGSDVNAVNRKNETALILAVKKSDVKLVRLLIEKGCALSPKDEAGKSALTYAIENSNSELAGLLEKAGAVRDYLGMEWKGNVSKQKNPYIWVVGTKKEWSDLWLRAFEKPAPEMDFEKFAVACVFLGYSAQWLYSIEFGKAYMREKQMIIPYILLDVMLRLSGPFQAGGQYSMRVYEKAGDAAMILEKAALSGRRR